MIPKKLVIGPMEYRVEFPYNFNGGTNKDLLGMHIGSQALIRVANTYNGVKMGIDRIHETFMHEMLHAIDFVYCGGENQIEHSKLSKLSIGLYRAVLDNNIRFNDEKYIPKRVFISPFYYEIKYPFKFEDEIRSTYSYIKHSDSTMWITGSDDIGKCDPRYIKSLLIRNIVCAVSTIAFTDEDYDEEFDVVIPSISSGFYQVMKDNNLEQIFKRKKGK